MEESKEEMEIEKNQAKGFPKKTLLLIIFLIFVASGLTTLALYINNAPKLPIPTPTPVLVLADTELIISSSPQKTASASAYKLDIFIRSGKNKVTKAQIELLYDPLLLTNVDIVSGSFFASGGKILLKNIDQKNGRITFVTSQGSDENGVLGSGVLATILFSATKALPVGGNISINFEPKTQVSALNTSKSVIKSTTGASFALTKAPVKISSESAILNKPGTSSAN